MRLKSNLAIRRVRACNNMYCCTHSYMVSLKKQLLFVFDIFPRVWVTSQMNKETPKDAIVLYEININKMSAI